ncbi:RHS repeat domain-containing protein, partial [Endozoicomonas acroporae]|uniref:RHS repeat domain-containing protein n=1 Tax=Endozoicomonas acroporae TaxID=1701104 RepID=UPI003D7A226A
SFEAFAAGATTPTTTAEYAHDALGRRVLKRVNGTTTHFQWQGNKINAEYDEYGVLVKRYRFALGSSPLQYKTIGALYDVINDHLSTPRVLTNQLHSLEWVSSVSPFGVVDVEKGQSIEFNIRFPGQYFDEESGLNYNRFRDYSPKIGRYIQADPIGLNGGNNGFSYVLGNPVSLVDEYGLCPAGGVLCATGAFVVGYLAKQTPGALISASSNFGVEYAKSGDIKNAAKKGGYGLAMGYMPGGSGVGFTALKTYGGSIVGTKVVDRKSVMTADAHFNASVASAASVLTYPVTNFVVGAQPTLGQMLVAEGAGQSLEYLAGGVRDGWQNLPRDNGFMCLEH